METVLWILIGMGTLFLCMCILAIIFIVRLNNKNKLRVNIILKTHRLRRFTPKKKDDISYKENKYVYDEEALIRGQYKDDIFFYEGNPKPIVFDFKSNIPTTHAKDLQIYLDNRLVEQLFAEKLFELMKILLIIAVVGIGICIILLFIIVTKKGVNIADNPANKELIISWIKEGITTTGV